MWKKGVTNGTSRLRIITDRPQICPASTAPTRPARNGPIKGGRGRGQLAEKILFGGFKLIFIGIRCCRDGVRLGAVAGGCLGGLVARIIIFTGQFFGVRVNI